MEIDKYISMRNSGKYELEWFYKYYLENKKNPNFSINIQEFQRIFNFGNLEEILSFLDIKFKLTRIYNENNELIRVYE